MLHLQLANLTLADPESGPLLSTGLAPADEMDRYSNTCRSLRDPSFEQVRGYRVGGYHPVKMGDFFKGSRYQIVRKLGHDSVSTTWLVQDHEVQRFVSLKILIARVSQTINEASILHHLAQVPPSDGAQHIAFPIDVFEHHGPNGTHICLVSEPMASHVGVVRIKLDFMSILDLHIVKRILKQTLQALAFLHGNGVMHGGLGPHCVLFPAKSLTGLRQRGLSPELLYPWGIHQTPTERSSAEEKVRLPAHLFTDYALDEHLYDGLDFAIKLVDMGGAWPLSRPTWAPATVSLSLYAMRPPELILASVVHPSLDMWSFGCLVFELLTKTPLFQTNKSPARKADDDILLQMTGLLGPLPDDLYGQWERASRYFTDDRVRTRRSVRPGGAKAKKAKYSKFQYLANPESKTCDADLESAVKSIMDDEGERVQEEDDNAPLPCYNLSIDDRFNAWAASKAVSKEQAAGATALLRRILQYDPAKRPTAVELLHDPWFADVAV